MKRLSLVLILAALSGCSATSTRTLDPNYKACIDAGGSYREPVSDGIGFRCDIPAGKR